MTAPILSGTFWKNNSELIRDVAALGYLDDRMTVLDPTFGKGNWWKLFRPRGLITSDLVTDGVDARNLPWKSNRFNAIALDLPYVSTGGRKTTTIRAMYEAYGLTGAPTTPRKLQRLINDSMREAYRVVRPATETADEDLRGGIVLVKVMSYISSGNLWLGEYETIKAARKIGFVVEDRFVHFRKSGGPQPQGRTRKLKDGRVIPSKQQHSRNNTSTLLVLRKMKKSA